MKVNEKDGQILQHITHYCSEIEATIKFFGKNCITFERNFIYSNALSIPMAQIGELSKHFSNEFIDSTKKDIPWKEIKGMRNVIAHNYHSMDKIEIWNTAINDIPTLNKYYQKILRENKLDIPKIFSLGLSRGR